MFKALVLDLDGVIRHLDIEIAERAAQSIGFSHNELMNTLWSNDYSYELLCGRSTRDEWWEHVHKFDRRLEEVSQDIIWNEVFERSYLDRELIEYVRGLKGKLTTGILTNCDRESKIQILEELGNNHPFDYVLSSSDLGTAKPEPEAFNGLLDRIGVEAEQCVFFDDALANVEGAQDQGIIAYYYEGLTHLREVIEKSMS